MSNASNASEVVILGAGMHPWGKWGRNFVEYGVVAARAALADAGLYWNDVGFLAAGNTMRNGYPGYVAGSTFAQALGWRGVRVSSGYAACASGAVAVDQARAQIQAGRCDVALVVGADTAPKGFFGPLPGERPEDPDWVRFRILGATNPTYFALYARRRMEQYGATTKDFSTVKVKNSRHGLHNPNARYRKEFTYDEIAESPVVADPLRLVDICATSDGAAALVLASAEFAARRDDRDRHVRIAAISTVTPQYPNTYLDMPDIATDSAVGATVPERSFRDSVAAAAYEEAGAEGAFQKWGYEVAAQEFAKETIPWSEVESKHGGKVPEGKILIQDTIADIMFQKMLLRPSEFDVIATPNLNGDYLSDAIAAEVGGVGIAPGANIGDTVALFEATHGTAPKYTNLDKVNPGSLLFSGVMMLEHIGWQEAADRVTKAYEKALDEKIVTYDFARQMQGATEVKTSEFATAVIRNMG